MTRRAMTTTLCAATLALWLTGGAAAVTALTVYDMLKAVDRAMVIERVQLESKMGGKSGEFVR